MPTSGVGVTFGILLLHFDAVNDDLQPHCRARRTVQFTHSDHLNTSVLDNHI